MSSKSHSFFDEALIGAGQVLDLGGFLSNSDEDGIRPDDGMQQDAANLWSDWNTALQRSVVDHDLLASAHKPTGRIVRTDADGKVVVVLYGAFLEKSSDRRNEEAAGRTRGQGSRHSAKRLLLRVHSAK